MFSKEEINLMRSLGLDCDFNGLSETDEYLGRHRRKGWEFPDIEVFRRAL